MERNVKTCRYTIKSEPVDDTFEEDPQGWLVKRANQYGLTTLLAHAADGVNWGTLAGNTWVLSHDAFPEIGPELRAETLQQLRLFSGEAELLLWRREGCASRWRARLLDDRGDDRAGWRLDEAQVQWGDYAEDEHKGFTLLAEGQEGRRHAVPLPKTKMDFTDDNHPVRLGVRHYLAQDESGVLFITQSRLTGLWVEPFEEVSNG